MNPDRKRRSLLKACTASALLLPSFDLFARRPAIAVQLQALEQRHGGRLGVSILETGSGQRLDHRGGERFPLCSTFKVLAAACVLKRVDAGDERLDRRIAYAGDALVEYSPVTGKHADGPGMTLAELCHAAVTVSDNTAGNLLLDSFGGAAGLTAFMRGLGDATTRLDRREPALNEAIPGDPRDTTTPTAMADSLHRLLVGDALSVVSRKQLAAWMIVTTTGGQRLRAGLPDAWRVGDKTGTSGNGVSNDVAIAWPPGRAPLIVTAYYAESQGPQERRNAVLAEVGRIAGEHASD